eukprot:31450_1
MENEFQQKLNDVRFEKNLAKFCNISQDKLPKISIKGQYTMEKIFSYQIDQFGRHRQAQIQQIQQNIVSKHDKSLYNMSSNEINQVIIHWLLSDLKFQSFSDAIMKTIKNKNINGLLIAEINEKNMNLKQYLNNLIGEYIEDKMMDKIAHKLKSAKIVEMDSSAFAEWICEFSITTLFHQSLYDNHNIEINGKWIVDNITNNKFQNILQDTLGISEDDAKQIYKFMKKYHVPSNETIISNINNGIRSQLYQFLNVSNIEQLTADAFNINYQILALKLKNNAEIDEEMEIISDLFNFLVMDNTNKNHNTKLNFGLVSKLYRVYANIFSELFLQEWYCCNCNYLNRSIKIHGKYITPLDKFMKNCLVCGINKIDSITETLKENSMQIRLFYADKSKINQNKIVCNGGRDISTCLSVDKLLKFVKEYTQKEYVSYISSVSQLRDDEIYELILRSISNITNQMEKKILIKMFESQHDVLNINSAKLLKLQEQDLMKLIFDQTDNVKSGTIKKLYKHILNEMDQFVSDKRIKMFAVSHSEIIKIWKHVLQKHLDLNDYRSYEYLALHLDECNELKCQSIERDKERYNHRLQQTENEYDDNKDEYNEHIYHAMFDDLYYKSVFDSIHCSILHPKKQRKELKKIRSRILIDGLFFNENEDTEDTPDDTDTDAIEGYEGFDANIEMTQMNTTAQQINITKNQKDNSTETIELHDRYTTDIGLFGFGLDHKHEYLKPYKDNTCFKIELINTKFIHNEKWKEYLNKAINKFKLTINNPMFVSKQFNADYSINRGDSLGIHHIVSIIIYTDFSKLCTEFRSTFRKIHKDETDEQIRQRHSKYYFLSRFLFEAIDCHGSIMDNGKTVFHGLNKPFLFKQFQTHFNAPTSTTEDKFIARNFSQEAGIILELKNGNKDTKNDIISRFASNQPRYLDVSWLSQFDNEKELLFFGSNIIFEIVDITHREIPKNTLKRLIMFQRIIKNKSIKWDNESTKRINGLARQINSTRENIIKLSAMNDDYKNDAYQNEINELQSQLTDKMTSDQFFEFSINATKKRLFYYI